MSDEPKTYYQYVSSITGQTVTKAYAEAHPKETYRRTVYVKREVVELPEPDELTAESPFPLEEPTPSTTHD